MSPIQIRDYNFIKTKLKTDYNIDTEVNDIEDFESTIYRDDSSGVIISDLNLLKRYISNCSESESESESTVIRFNDFKLINEDGGIGSVTGGNISGMGAVVSAQPSQVPGQTMGGSLPNSSFGTGGIVGSGDIATGDKGKAFGYGSKSKSGYKNTAKRTSKRGRKKLSNQIDSITDYVKTSGNSADVMSFTEFEKKNLK